MGEANKRRESLGREIREVLAEFVGVDLDDRVSERDGRIGRGFRGAQREDSGR